MPSKNVTVRRKENISRKNHKVKIVLISLLSLFAVITVFSTFIYFSGNSEFATNNLEIAVNGKNKIIRVPKGGNLQTAINRAEGGDIIELEAGATYTGEFILPKKALTDFITIQSSRAKELPENQRVTPAQANLMAKIITPGKGKPAVSTEKGAHHYRFVGIEFSPSNSDYIYNLIFFGEPEKVSETAHHLEIDRCFVHSIPDGITRRGVALNSAQTEIKNSHFQGFAYPGEETQGICGWTGTKDVKIINNYIEGGAENIMFGGSEPASEDLIPANIEVSGNHLKKPAVWKEQKNSMKNLFELKNAKRVQFVGNYLENSWMGAALTITVRNENGGAPFSTIEDTLIKDNVIDGAGEGINILGMDNNFPSQVLKRLTVMNNLFLNIGGEDFPISSGYFIQITDGTDILIANNTVFNVGNIAKMYGTLPKNFLFRDNIVNHGLYGIHGHPNIYSADGQKLYENNVIINNRNIQSSDYSYPRNNFLVADHKDIGFVDFAKKDFRLMPNSRFKSKNGSAVGSNINLSEIKKTVAGF